MSSNTPASRRFLLPKRGLSQTPQFTQSTPKFQSRAVSSFGGSSSAQKPPKLRDGSPEDVKDVEMEDADGDEERVISSSVDDDGQATTVGEMQFAPSPTLGSMPRRWLDHQVEEAHVDEESEDEKIARSSVTDDEEKDIRLEQEEGDIVDRISFPKPPLAVSSTVRPATQRELGRAIEDPELDSSEEIVRSSPPDAGAGVRAPRDPIEEDSQSLASVPAGSQSDRGEVLVDLSSPPEEAERAMKRRRITVSPLEGSSPTPERRLLFHKEEVVGSSDEDEAPSGTVDTGERNEEEVLDACRGSDDVREEDEAENATTDSEEDHHDDRRHNPPKAQPTFRSAPRFKPPEEDLSAPDGLPLAFFSPQRRGAQYLPGGLASELQGWLSDVRKWDEEMESGAREARGARFRVRVDKARKGGRMYLVHGRVQGGRREEEAAERGPERFVLAGEGRLTGLDKGRGVEEGSLVEVKGLTWEVELEGDLKRISDPLHILFCGSDDFSCTSLRRVDGARRDPSWCGPEIESVDVLVRPHKRVGRGRTKLNQIPLERLAMEGGLNVHHLDDFRDWELPRGINLIIAVSFGLFIPARIINAAKYGGLNVHPSLLPDLRGSAPIQHALLKGYSHTGVTVQTLHPSRFDAGRILAQTPRDQLYPLAPGLSVAEHTAELASLGANMLKSVIQRELHAHEGEHDGWRQPARQQGPLNIAPKVTKQDSRVLWSDDKAAGKVRWAGPYFERAFRVFGSAWTCVVDVPKEATADAALKTRRVKFDDVEVLTREQMEGEREGHSAQSGAVEGKQEMPARHFVRMTDKMDEGQPRSTDQGGDEGIINVPVELLGDSVYFQLGNGETWVRVHEVTVSGKPKKGAAKALRPFLLKQTQTA